MFPSDHFIFFMLSAQTPLRLFMGWLPAGTIQWKEKLLQTNRAPTARCPPFRVSERQSGKTPSGKTRKENNDQAIALLLFQLNCPG
jgi:hypothetical protein